MYGVIWDAETNGIRLIEMGEGEINSPIRPVFHEELDMFRLDKYWKYPKTAEPLLWAAGRSYYYCGEKVAEIHGGGFYSYPEIKVIKKDLKIKPVDINGLIEKNKRIIENVTHTTLDFIAETYKKLKDKVDRVIVAFSGGKDSTVLLDLVQRVLAPDEYIVVFNDTTMELSSTYEFLEKDIKRRYANLKFFVAKYEKPAPEMWRKIGIPSRIHRWCCTIYKTAPTIKLIKRIIKKETPKILVYDGIRSEEGAKRAKMSYITKGKHLNQINVHPIIEWNSALIYLYTFMRKLPINKVYRYGAKRVGCAVCPFASEWWETIIWLKFRDEISEYLKIIREYARTKGIKKEEEIKQFISWGDWKVRIGGRDIQKKEKVFLINSDGKPTLIIEKPNKNFLDWIKVLGDITVSKNMLTMRKNDAIYYFKWHATPREFEVTFVNGHDINLLQLVKTVAYKAAYCIGCGACEVECPKGAIKVTAEKIFVDEKTCVHCYKCLTFTDRGCLVADSRKVGSKVKGMSGIGKYKHFGIRKGWLKEFFDKGVKKWIIDGKKGKSKLGSVQFEAMRLWLQDCEIIKKERGQFSMTELGKALKEIGENDLLTWAVIWTNLARNSVLIKWYIDKLEWGKTYKKEELINLMGDLSNSKVTKENGIGSLREIFKYSPIGKDLKIGIIKRENRKLAIEKKGLTDANKLPLGLDPLAILYTLYRYAEKKESWSFGVSHLYSDFADEGPYKLFGIPRKLLEKILIGLSERYGGEWIRVELIADLDNIYLNPKKKSIDVLKLYIESIK